MWCFSPLGESQPAVRSRKPVLSEKLIVRVGRENPNSTIIAGPAVGSVSHSRIDPILWFLDFQALNYEYSRGKKENTKILQPILHLHKQC